MHLHTWAFFVATVAALSATPGPAVLFVLSEAISRGALKSFWACLGILCANGVYFALSATSLGAVIFASYNLFSLIKWAGAAYLIYMAGRCFFARSRFSALPLPDLETSERSNRRAWVDGFFLQGANPAALVFFAAILPQFVDPKTSIPLQVLILGISAIVVEFCILVAYGRLADRALSVARTPRFERVTNWAAGTLLLGASLGLAFFNAAGAQQARFR